MDDRILNEILNELKEIKNILISKLEKPYFPYFEKRTEPYNMGISLTQDIQPETPNKRGRRKKNE